MKNPPEQVLHARGRFGRLEGLQISDFPADLVKVIEPPKPEILDFR